MFLRWRDTPKPRKLTLGAILRMHGGTGERFVAVLEIPPVESPLTAVRAAIVADAKGKI
jgi:hypothetical protein